MLAPVEWLCDLVGLEETPRGEDVAADLVRVGLEEESITGGDITGPLVVGRVLDVTDEPQKNGKTIHFCHVDVGNHGQREAAGGDPAVTQEIVCGAHNFSAGDHVVCILPGGVLPGDFAISARKTYGHMSNGMICSQAELGLGEDHDGIIVLEEMFADRPEVLASLRPAATQSTKRCSYQARVLAWISGGRPPMARLSASRYSSLPMCRASDQ